MSFIKKTFKLLVIAVLVAAFAFAVTACETDADTDSATYTVTFVSNGGTGVAAQQVEEGKTATRPSDPERSGYTFIDWYPDSSCSGEPFNFNTPVTSDISVYAKWQVTGTPDAQYITLTLDYCYDGKTDTRQVEKGTAASIETPSREGYSFGGWYEDAALLTLFNLNTALQQDTVLFAKWIENSNESDVTYTVTFESNGGSAITSLTVTKGETLTSVPSPFRAGYTFAGWFTDEQLTQQFLTDSPVNANLTLYAKWNVTTDPAPADTYTVTFESNGGSSVLPQTVNSGEKATMPATPSLDGKIFANWYTDAACTKVYDFATPVTADITLYAGWATLASDVLSAGGYSESLYVTWAESLPSSAEVYYRDAESAASDWIAVDGELIRQTSAGVARADILGLKAGSYYVKVKPSAGAETQLPAPITVAEYDRSGYAHFNYTEGVGAYNDDGTIKNNKNGTLVIYLTDENKNDISDYAYVNGVKTDISKYFWNGYKGIGYLLNNRQYNSNTERATYGIQALCFYYDAVVIRVLGTVNAENPADATVSLIDGLTAYSSTANGGSVGDNGRMARICNAKNLTFEGVGEDACIYGWGIHFVSNDNLHLYEGSGKSFEVRNLTFQNYPEDAIGMEGTQGTKVDSTGSITSGDSSAEADLISPVERCWIHNNVFLPGYCAKPAESDKAEGDGSCDFKRGQYYTLSYNYFEYCHKTNLIGSSDTSLTYNVTMHHNWWNNCGSRQPLARRANIHFYNNYITGDSTDSNADLSYVTSLRANCLVFSEANYYEGCKNVTQLKDGVGVSWNNVYYACTGENSYVQLTSRTQTVTNSCKFIYRNIDYSQFYIDSSLFYYDSVNQVSDCLIDSAVAARAKVMQFAGVNGFGTANTAMNYYTPSSAVKVNSAGETVIALPSSKADTEVNGVLFRGLTGTSSGTIKGKGQIITFTLAAEAQLTVSATASSSDYYPELVGADGTVWANKFSGTLTIVLPAGTYFIGSGDRSKESTISYLSFADTAASSAARMQALSSAIDAISSTVTLESADQIKAAQLAYSALTSSEKITYETQNAARLDKLNNAVAQYETLLVQDVIAKIKAIGAVTANSYDAICAAQSAYDALETAELKNRVTNYSALTAAWNAYNEFAVSNVISKIEGLVDVSTLSLTDKTAIDQAQTAYDAAAASFEKLTEEQQTEVTNYAKLTDGLAALAQLEKLFEFKDSLSGTDANSVTIGEGAALKALYDSLTAQQKAALTTAEQTKYSEIQTKYESLASQLQTCSFDGAPDNAAWTVSGNYYTGTLTINSTGDTFSKGLKMESTTSVSFSTATTMELTLYFHSTNAGKIVKIDGVDYTVQTAANGDCYITLTVEAGTHTITKNTTNTYLYLAVLSPIA